MPPDKIVRIAAKVIVASRLTGRFGAIIVIGLNKACGFVVSNYIKISILRKET